MMVETHGLLDSVYEAHQIVNELMKAPPVENSYLTHNHVFAHRLTDAFNRVGVNGQ